MTSDDILENFDTSDPCYDKNFIMLTHALFAGLPGTTSTFALIVILGYDNHL